jgi:hypothetical protein
MSDRLLATLIVIGGLLGVILGFALVERVMCSWHPTNCGCSQSACVDGTEGR